MNRFAISLLGLALIGTGSWASRASAQTTEGAFQIALSTTLLSYTSGSLELELDSGDVEADSSIFEWGINQPVALELGYGITDMFLVGGFLQLGGDTTDTEYEDAESLDNEESSIEVAVGPKLDIILLPGSSTRPFFTAAAGFVLSNNDGDELEMSLAGLELVGRIGLRAFVARSFSLDPALFVSWSTVSGELESDTDSADISATAFSVGLQLGASGWLL